MRHWVFDGPYYLLLCMLKHPIMALLYVCRQTMVPEGETLHSFLIGGCYSICVVVAMTPAFMNTEYHLPNYNSNELK